MVELVGRGSVVEQDLDAFREQVATFRKNDRGEARPYSQRELAEEIGLHRTELSNRLNGTKQARLTSENVRAIVRTLVRWRKIATRSEARALLDLMACTMPAEDWNALPFVELKDDEAQAAPPDYQLPPDLAQHALTPCRLPTPLTRLIGRDYDLEAARCLVRTRTVRLLTVLGPAGVGKSVFALHLASALSDDFADGGICIDLATVSEPSAVLPTIADALGLCPAPETLAQVLAQTLRHRRLLLVLDTFEHVVSAAPDVAALLEACPHLQLLVTSREALAVRGEHVLALRPLPVPDERDPVNLEALAQIESVALFVDRARAIEPTFTLTASNVAAVASLCARLDGFPLAIELAAARMLVFTPQELLQRLTGTFEHTLLRARRRDVSYRHQTLDAAIDWSFSLLEATERQLFVRLGIFTGGFTAAAVDAICCGHGDPALDTVVGLSSLAQKYLIYVLQRPDGQRRFVLYQTVRDFVQSRLVADAELPDLRCRYVTYYLNLARAASRALHGPEWRFWHDQLVDERSNLDAVFWDALQRGDVERAFELIDCLWWCWGFGTYWSEGRRWFEAALPLKDAVPVPVYARALLAAGTLALHRADVREAVARLDESLVLLHAVGDRQGIGLAAIFRAHVARLMGDLAYACELVTQGLAIFGGEESANAALALLARGNVLYDQGDTGAAELQLTAALKMARRQQYMPVVAWALYSLGGLARNTNNLDVASLRLDESLTIFRLLYSAPGMAAVLNEQGRTAHAAGKLARAAVVFKESLACAQRLGSPLAMARAMEGLAAIAHQRQETVRAAQLFLTAASLREIAGSDLIREPHIHDAVLVKEYGGTRLAIERPASPLSANYTVEHAVAEAMAVAAYANHSPAEPIHQPIE